MNSAGFEASNELLILVVFVSGGEFQGTRTEFAAEAAAAADSDPTPCSPQKRPAVALLAQPVNNAITRVLYNFAGSHIGNKQV